MFVLRIVSLFVVLLYDAPYYRCTALCFFRKLNHVTAFSSLRSLSVHQISSSSALHQTQSNNDDTVKGNVNSNKKSTPLVYKHISLLIAIWQKIHDLAQNSDSDVVEDDDDDYSDFVLSEYYGANTDTKSSKNRKLVDGVIKHFQFCKDTCAADGAFLMATQNSNDQDLLRLSRVNFAVLTNEEARDVDWGNFDRDLLAESPSSSSSDHSVFPVENDDTTVLKDTKAWVQKVIADFAVCPFTIDPNRAGIPLGGVRYRATGPDEAFLKFWQEVQLLLTNPEKDIATTLLVFPEIDLFGNYELFEAYCECLSDALTVTSINLETEIQLVFFHPKFQFRDGNDRSGGDDRQSAANFARRGPWPMINLLRTSQVRSAQKGIPTGQVYQQNEQRLGDVGSTCLEKMLYTRDWEELPSHVTKIKTETKIALANKQIVLNLDNPLLTSLSDGTCPFSSGKLAGASSSGSKAVSTTTSSSNNNNNNKKKKNSTADLIGNAKKPATTPSPPPAPPAAVPKGKKEVDYLKLAEDVDEWLASGGWS